MMDGGTVADPLSHVVAVARAQAESVDIEGRFPSESIAAMRETGLLGALVPVALGGPGLSVTHVARACYAIGQACASSAMVLAMHHIQLACLVDHAGDSAWHQNYLSRVAQEGLLLASVTSEAGVGGSMRTSLCALQLDAAPGRFTLEKRATAISYGAYADALLVTARSLPDADASDQVLVVVPSAGAELERTGGWNAMGMRGTCSEAFHLRSAGARCCPSHSPRSPLKRWCRCPICSGRASGLASRRTPLPARGLSCGEACARRRAAPSRPAPAGWWAQ
jgi:acyl-CoA dehydrogenase